ncbi:MAG: alternative ribosome rescue aminoacyl-tRNA hydrolase ArfB [Candidatus Uhrbacteria bacterium]|nr:alternative ribosome rescue aminoacyl-tRNA hydrolase ArfB [Candidatus Uhrbacteria bacterium]
MLPREIPAGELRFTYVGSRGPGGQNVNKTATKVQVRWHIESSTGFTMEEKQILQTRLKTNEAGEMVLSCDETRSQPQNKKKVIARLHALVTEALKPEIERIASRPTKGSQERRVTEKKHRGAIKSKRRKQEWE